MTGRSEILSFATIRAKFLAFVVPLVLLSTIAVFGLFELTARRDANLKLILAALAIDPDVESAAVYDERDLLVGRTGSTEKNEPRPFFASK